VLRRAVESMAAAAEIERVIVVTTEARAETLETADWLAAVGGETTPGGERRQDSVAAGVRAADAGVVLVHDAARPFVSPSLISRIVQAVHEHGAAIPVLAVVDALKRVEGGRITGTAERSGLYRAQTPQGARRELLHAAAESHAGGPEIIADEAELLARAGVPVATVPGEATNIKLTLPEDVLLAERMMAGGPGGRVAQGYDSHPFGPDRGLRLGGLTVSDAPRLQGHSDGDVVLHAVCDGLLGAAGMGDLGRLFPSGERATRGIDSRDLVAEVVARLAAAGLVPSSVDVSILGARPRLGARRLDAMADAIADLVGLDRRHVSVKAATGNLSGDEGAGRVISASSIVSVRGR
jgi:2-C-methyl-D-erythritol 4-phosphate cytidylyltransferase/2-C-methyl-D-erythritol 2,4-cyclodiphosphate synthase